MTNDVEPRRSPVQDRSKERVGRILAAAEALLVEVGARDLKMNHIARKAGVPIGSVYQYFPNREAILRALVDAHHAQFSARLQAIIDQVTDFGGLLTALNQGFDALAADFRTSRSYRQLWSGTQTWEPLRALDVADTLHNARIIKAALLRVMPGLSEARAMASCIMMCDVSGSLTRLAYELEPDAESRVLEEAKVMMADYLTMLFRRQQDEGPG